MLAWILLAGLIYPILYETVRCLKYGIVEFWTNPENFITITYITLSIAMSVIHITFNPFNFLSKLIIILVLFASIVRTFKLMRVVEAYSPIITMLSSVVVDLQQFIIFYIILIALFALVPGILGINNTQ